ncbi:osteopetrosis-associated transmembrane protein 1-like [Diadema antillarum]|uniref:osteopetrosis-associated transmembrane protein 1-like n=1 Tax=Diadema antillarum TaxID=105358 RepID=UPI003A853DAA
MAALQHMLFRDFLFKSVLCLTFLLAKADFMTEVGSANGADLNGREHTYNQQGRVALQYSFSESDSGEGAGDDAFAKCQHRDTLLKNYSEASSEFLECAVKRAKPVRICEKCVREFKNVHYAWDMINKDDECKEDILVSDTLQIVTQTHTFLQSLWDVGLCENCYSTSSHFEASNSTMQFLRHYNETIDCFIAFGGHVPGPEDNNTTSICTNCSEQYKALNHVYNSIPENGLCMDIIDLMNRTRMQWKSSGCTWRERNFTFVTALSVFICILPLFFYLTAKIHGTKKEQKLVKKSRQQRRGLTASDRLFAGTADSLR